MLAKKELYTLLDSRGIPYEAVEHPAVYTMEEMEALVLPGQDRVLKNLFLRDDKRRNYYLVSMAGHKTADLKTLRHSLSSRPLSFASPLELGRLLHLESGHVTPLAALNDESRTVTVVLDRDLAGRAVGVHPMENTATVFLALEAVQRLLEDHGTPVILCEI